MTEIPNKAQIRNQVVDLGQTQLVNLKPEVKTLAHRIDIPSHPTGYQNIIFQSQPGKQLVDWNSTLSLYRNKEIFIRN